MPRLLSEYQLNQVKYVSMADYIRKMDELEYIEDKLAFTTRYLLSYGAGQQRDVPLEEAIHVAKMKIADASAKIRAELIMVPDEAVDPNLSDEQDASNRLFMLDPVAYLQNEANRLLLEQANQNPTEEVQQRIADYQLMSAVLANGANDSLPQKIDELDVQPSSRDVEARLKARFGGAREFKRAYNATKPGFLSKAFGTSSKAYSNLDEVYNAFNNPDHVLYGDMNALDKAATEYLQHCFPKWNPKQGMISKSSVERLKGTQKARAMFSLNLLKATAEQRQGEPVYERILMGNRQRRAEMEAQAGDEVLENPQNDNAAFQQGVLDEVAKEEDLAVDSEQAEKDYHDNFVEGPEAENDDPDLE